MKNIDPILQSDLNHIAAAFPHWEELAGKAVLVTGATGYTSNPDQSVEFTHNGREYDYHISAETGQIVYWE